MKLILLFLLLVSVYSGRVCTLSEYRAACTKELFSCLIEINTAIFNATVPPEERFKYGEPSDYSFEDLYKEIEKAGILHKSPYYGCEDENSFI